MAKLFQISEDDLAELERVIPELGDALFATMDSRLRVKIRRVKTILSDVRWNYGPPSHVEQVDEPDQDS